MTCEEILQLLASRPDPRAIAGMARYGIVAKKVHGGWSTPEIKKLAGKIGRDHPLALELWGSEVFEARILGILVAEPAKVTKRQMDLWAKDFDNWAICDGACIHLFRYSPFAFAKCVEWSRSPREFVKRAGFALMAGLAVADKAAGDAAFRRFLPIIKSAATDEKHGQESRELGSPPDRKAQCRVERGRRNRRGGNLPAQFPRGAMDCLGRPA